MEIRSFLKNSQNGIVDILVSKIDVEKIIIFGGGVVQYGLRLEIILSANLFFPIID